MMSKVAKEAERALVEATQRLGPEERLNAFVAHCRLSWSYTRLGRRRGVSQRNRSHEDDALR